MISSPIRIFSRFWHDRSASVSIEFILVVPLVFFFFIACAELSFLMIRQVQLDRAMDETVRFVRLNTLNPPDYEDLRELICTNSGFPESCSSSLKLEMFSQNPRGTLVLDTTPDCIDRDLNVQPASRFETGNENEVMFLRACIQFKPIFPTATLGSTIKDANGEYALISTSLYVTEPGA